VNAREHLDREGHDSVEEADFPVAVLQPEDEGVDTGAG
jgi:hypothetical protein